MKKLLSILFFCGVALCAYSDEVEFKASAPPQVIVGKPFKLTYTINQSAKDLRVPELSDFDYVAGPSQAVSSMNSFTNGTRTSSYTLSITYVLVANREGDHNIPAATIKVDGKQYYSNGLKIKVLPPDQQTSDVKSNNAPDQNQGGDIFIRTLVSKTTVHEQEAILLTYKLYSANVDFAQWTNNTRLPEFKGFLKQDIELGETQAELEHYNGRNYQTAVIYRTLLFPQRSGDIEIDPAYFEAVLRVQNRAPVRSVFEDFFNSYTSVVKPLEVKGVTIHVEPLPTGKPASFSGAVGQFTIDSKISSASLQANEAVTLTLTIQGAGNMKLIKTPAVDWPEGFEAYDAKVTNDFRNTNNGTSGSKVIEYLAIPRAGGTYVVPAIEFAYYDTKDDVYRTLKTQEYTLNVARAPGEESSGAVVSNYVNKEDIQHLGSDIRYIYTGTDLTHQSTLGLRFGSLLFWMCYMIPLLLAFLLFVVFRKKIAENADITRVRYKKANKVAMRRLKTAKQLLNEFKKEAFYEEIERAAWTYLGDRLSIPTAQLNKENIAQILRDKNVNESLIQDVINVLSEAEFARYAPVSDHAMQEMYDATTNLINNLESLKL